MTDTLTGIEQSSSGNEIAITYTTSCDDTAHKILGAISNFSGVWGTFFALLLLIVVIGVVYSFVQVDGGTLRFGGFSDTASGFGGGMLSVFSSLPVIIIIITISGILLALLSVALTGVASTC